MNEPTVQPSKCECDYDYEDERYHKTTHYCPEHDMCESCDEYLGVLKDPDFDKTVSKRPMWLCIRCACVPPKYRVKEEATA